MRILLLVLAAACVTIFTEVNGLKHVWLVGVAVILGEVSDTFKKSPPASADTST